MGKTEQIQGEQHAWGYTYDEAGRLVQTVLDGKVYERITYDENSNRVEYTDSSGKTITADYDDQDRLLRYGKATFTYTAVTRSLTLRVSGREVLRSREGREARMVGYSSTRKRGGYLPCLADSAGRRSWLLECLQTRV